MNPIRHFSTIVFLALCNIHFLVTPLLADEKAESQKALNDKTKDKKSFANPKFDSPYVMPRVVERPTIDGVVDKIEWRNANITYIAYETNPGNNLPAKVKTKVYMMEDGDSLYFAFEAEDPNPEKILAYLRDQDRIFQDDFVGVVLDTFNDERRGFEFFVNPMGSQGDLTRDDARFNEDSSWNTVWDSMGKVTDKGYTVEMEIPYRALRFPSGLKEQIWGIQFLRIYPRENRTVFSDAPSNRELDCVLCQVRKVKGMPSLVAGNNIDITPTLTYLNSEERDPYTDGTWTDGVNDSEIGLNLRWAVTENWIVNGTLNPDFSQVGLDAAQLDVNTTFSLFFPETRPFFLDGADYFAVGNRLVHTRNISNPDYGLKLTGKSNGHTAGTILARDTSTTFLIPGSQGSDLAVLETLESDILVGRYQKDIGDRNNIGALVTKRSGEGYDNTVTSFDGKYYFNKSDSISIQYMHSDSTNPQVVQDDFELDAEQTGSAYSLRLDRNKEDYGLRFAINDFGKDFRADMGFVRQVNYKKIVAGGNYTWYGDKDNAWTRWGFFGDWDRTEDQDGNFLEEESELHFNLRGPMQFNTNFGFVKRNRQFDGEIFDENQFMMWFEFRPVGNLQIGNFMLLGDRIDFANAQLGEQTLFEPYIDWQLGKHFNANLSTTFQTLNVPNGELFNATLVDLRLSYQFNIRSRLSLTIQRTDVDRDPFLYPRLDDGSVDLDIERNSKNMGMQLVYSYKINPLSLVYLGYSDNAIDDDDLRGLEKDKRSIFAKFSYMWQY